jgi:hypothetical protein
VHRPGGDCPVPPARRGTAHAGGAGRVGRRRRCRPRRTVTARAGRRAPAGGPP